MSNIVSTPVIDFHAHVGRWGAFSMDDDPAQFMAIMDAAGVDRTCVNCIFFGEARRCNDYVASFVTRNPSRFIGVGFVTPHYPNEAMTELDRAFNKLGMKFLKIYPEYLGKPADDPSYDPIFEWVNEHGLPIMCHTSYQVGGDTLTMPRRFIKLAERFPKVKWVLAHSGNLREGQEQAIEAGRAAPNVYLETCTSLGEHSTIEFLVNGVGEDRVLFGTDMPLMDARYQIGRILTADIPDSAKRKVLGLNTIKLLKLDVS